MSEKVKTGYGSIDKPWMKYYEGQFDEADIPDMSIYQFLKKNTEEKKKQVAIDMRISKNDFKRGVKISYGDFHRLISKSAKASANIGINSILKINVENGLI